jgi:hypothetical protein
MDHERVGFIIPVHTHQDGTTVSAFAFDRRIGHFQRRRRRGHRFNKRRWNDLERPLWKSGHCCNSSKFRTRRKFVPAVAQFTNGRCCLLLTLQQRALGRLSAAWGPVGPWGAWGPVRLAQDGTR